MISAWMTVACSTTDRIDAGALEALRGRISSSGPLVLEDPQGERIRLDPKSDIRLILSDGRQTEWVPASRIAVTEDGRVVDGNRYLDLADIETVEVKNVDGVKTYFLTVGIVAVAAALIALVVAKSKGDGGQRSAPTAIPAGTPRQPRYAAAGTAWFYTDPWFYPRGPTFVFPIAGGRAAPNEQSEPPSQEPTKLFSRTAIRRSSIAPLMQLELGYGFDSRTGGGLSVGGGFALNQMFELTGGLRLSDLAGPQRFTLGYVRAGGNFPMEADGVFGAPIALDVAFGGDGFAHMRVIWGFRWRFPSQFEVAILPANPQLNLVDGDMYWDFPSMLQVGYRF